MNVFSPIGRCISRFYRALSSAHLGGMRMLVFSVVALTALMSVLVSCQEEQKSYVKNIGDGEHTPTMNTINVHTFISDSGYTKYYITAPLWSMYDEAKEPYWLFPEGLELEQYDEKLNVVANMRCDSAKYLSQRRLWRLDGHVMMTNVAKDTVLTKQLYWDQGRREIYTDSFIHIVRDRRIIEGKGFTSNEQMTAYTIKRPMGIFPLDHKPGQKPNNSSSTDTLHADERYRAPAPPRASERSSRSGIKPITHDTIPASMVIKQKTDKNPKKK